MMGDQEAWAKTAIFAHAMIHPELMSGCPTCGLIIRAQEILEDVLDCDLPYACRIDHDRLLGIPNDDVYEELWDQLGD